MATIRIGLAKLDDAAAMAVMARQWIEYGLPSTWHESRISHCIRSDECVAIVARDGRRLAGFALMQFYDAHAHLSLLAVQPGYRRRGIGRLLLEWLEATARTAGTFTVRLELRAANDAARAFYERLGYREAGRREAYYGGREDALRMTRDLAAVPAARGA